MSEIVKREKLNVVAGFGSEAGFELIQRQAKALSGSQLVPKHFQKNLPDCIIALEMAQRMGASPLMVCQNLYVVYGNPTFSAKFLVACINASGRFSPLRYKYTGVKGEDSWGCIAWAKDGDGEILESAEVTIAIAKAEGWYDKNGSKWQTIPQLMLQYRSATFFCRTYAPEVAMGMMTTEEARDINPAKEVHVEPIFFDDQSEGGQESASTPEFDRAKTIKSIEVIRAHRENDFLGACAELIIVADFWEDATDDLLACLLGMLNS